MHSGYFADSEVHLGEEVEIHSGHLVKEEELGSSHSDQHGWARWLIDGWSARTNKLSVPKPS